MQSAHAGTALPRNPTADDYEESWLALRGGGTLRICSRRKWPDGPSLPGHTDAGWAAPNTGRGPMRTQGLVIAGLALLAPGTNHPAVPAAAPTAVVAASFTGSVVSARHSSGTAVVFVVDSVSPPVG